MGHRSEGALNQLLFRVTNPSMYLLAGSRANRGYTAVDSREDYCGLRLSSDELVYGESRPAYRQDPHGSSGDYELSLLEEGVELGPSPKRKGRSISDVYCTVQACMHSEGGGNSAGMHVLIQCW